MGAVYKARDDLRDCNVAIKQSFRSDDKALHNQFIREAKLLARLSHPRLPEVHDYFTIDNEQFLVMDCIEGDDLAQVLQKTGKSIPFEQVMNWADQLLEVLEYIHNTQPPVIHRDIKPNNVKLKSDGRVMLLDFGLAKSPTATTPGMSVPYGTRFYAAPEQLKSEGTDHRSDLYSLGATLYHLLTNQLPLDSLTREEVIRMGHPDPLRLASDIDPRIAPWFAKVVQDALELRPQHRYQSANSMRRAIAYTEETRRTPARAPRQAPSGETTRRTPRPAPLRDSRPAVQPSTASRLSYDDSNSLSQPLVELFSRMLFRVTGFVGHFVDEFNKAILAWWQHITETSEGRKRAGKVFLLIVLGFFLAIFIAALVYWRNS